MIKSAIKLKASFLTALMTLFFVSIISPQNLRVQLGKPATTIPKICEGVTPASLGSEIDMPALIKEATCKGAGDMLAEFTYTMKLTQRQKNKKGEVKEESTVYEVYIPTLKSGTSAKGILLATSHNGVAVEAKELDKQRMQAGERLEKEENKIAHQAASRPQDDSKEIKGMSPIGAYAQMTMNTGMLGFGHGSASLIIGVFLDSCDLKLVRHEQVEGRETLVFNFSPKTDARFDDNIKYISKLTGEIWIDKQDRIVTKLVGWLSGSPAPTAVDKAPVYAEIIRLPEGLWLPRVTRLNAADYPTLFDHFSSETVLEYSDYKRFITNAKQEK